MLRKLILATLITSLLSVSGCSNSTGASVRPRYGVGVGYYGYGYGPWHPCRFGCGPPVIVRPRPEPPIPELPIEPPIFEATPLPELDFDMDFDEW